MSDETPMSPRSTNEGPTLMTTDTEAKVPRVETAPLVKKDVSMNLISCWAGAKWAVDFKEFKTKDVKYEIANKAFTTDGGLVLRLDTGFDLGDKGGKFSFLGYGFQYDKNDEGKWSGLHLFVPVLTL